MITQTELDRVHRVVGIPELPLGSSAEFTLEHQYSVVRVKSEELHENLPQFEVSCITCDSTLHDGTTRPSFWIADHEHGLRQSK